MYQNTPFYDIRPIRDFRDMLAQSAARFSDRPAFKLKNDAGEYYDVSYPDFQADVYALGTKLIDLGLAGEKIAVIGHNCYEWCTAYLAVTCGVGVVVPIDKELPACDIENILRVSEAAAILSARISCRSAAWWKSARQISCSLFCRCIILMNVRSDLS